jgi:hypothetical protein
MAARTGRRWLIRVLAVAAAAGCLVTLACWRYWPWREKYAVPAPPPSASARQVVLAYLRALDAHDSATADTLSTPGVRSTTEMWLSSTASITRIKIGPVLCDPHDPVSQQCQVSANFWYSSHWWKQDPSFGNGQHDWGYQLVRSHGRWLVDDEGAG